MIQMSVFMMFRQRRQENGEDENKNYKTALISSKNKIVHDKTIITAAIVQLEVKQYLLLYSLNAMLLYLISYLCAYDNYNR